MKKEMTKDQLIKEYRRILSMIADTGNTTKAAALKMRMESDGVDQNVIDEVVKVLIEEEETASELQ
jgi:hypothetical protein